MVGVRFPTLTRPHARIHLEPRMLAAALAAGAVVWAVLGWPVGGITVAVAVYCGPRLLRVTAARAVADRREALAEWIQRLAGLLAAGAGGIEDAIARSAHTAPALLADHITTLTFRTRALGAEPALRAFADDLADGEVDAVVASLILRVRDGGSGLVGVLHARAVTLRQQVQAELAVEAERQRPRTQMMIIMAIVAGTVAVLQMASHLLDSYATVDGQIWLGLVAAIWAVAFVWAFYLTRPATSKRFLVDDRTGGRR
ncbi:type II secretion system F family protein [Kutzneria buriramensis]|nr:pilus assembly protein TadB [Kutzneria buriramensis]